MTHREETVAAGQSLSLDVRAVSYTQDYWVGQLCAGDIVLMDTVGLHVNADDAMRAVLERFDYVLTWATKHAEA